MNGTFHAGLVLSACVAIGACSALPGSQQHKTVEYLCDGGQTIVASYFSAGKQHSRFVVLDWQGREYGLALAISASGARYAGLYGPTPAGAGLQWWEAKGEASLSAFTGKDLYDTRALLSGCRPQSGGMR